MEAETEIASKAERNELRLPPGPGVNLLTSVLQQKKWMSPGGAQSNPYGIAITSDGVVWYSESGVKPNTWSSSILNRKASAER